MGIFRLVVQCVATLGVLAVMGHLFRVAISCVREERDWYGVLMLSCVILFFGGMATWMWLEYLGIK